MSIAKQLADSPISLTRDDEPCVLCGTVSHTLLYRTHDRHYGIKGEFDVCQCDECGLVHLYPMPTESELINFYPDDYYAYQELEQGRKRLKQFLKTILAFNIHTRDPKFERPGRVLDVGCGSGHFLLEMKKQGWEVHGVEPSAGAAELGQSSAGINIVQGTMPSATKVFADDMFDYVRSNHSFEHMPNPSAVLSEMRRILNPQGKLFIGVPNIDSVNARVFGRYWWYLGAPVHTFNYSVSTLSSLLKKNGLRIERVRFNSDYGGVLGSLQIAANRTSGRKSTDGR